MKNLTNFVMKNSLTLPSLANKLFKSLGDENDELIYTYTDLFSINLVTQNIERGRCNAFNQHYKSIISDKVFNFVPKELDVNGKICEILEKKDFEFLNKNFKQKNSIQNLINLEILIERKKTDVTNNKLNILAIHEQLPKLNLNKTYLDFDATS